jgi:hypothetical protein
VSEHLGDDAELYPLGILDAAAAQHVEEHIATCPSCAERVAQALTVAGSLAAALPAREPSPELGERLRESTTPRTQRRARNRFDLAWALAAALVLALLALGWQNIVLRKHLARQEIALAMLVHSHFNHVSMIAAPGNTIAAKILYARNGSWIYIIVENPSSSLRAVGQTPVGTLDLGTLERSGDIATLLRHPRVRVHSIALKRGNVTLASAVLVYGR